MSIRITTQATLENEKIEVEIEMRPKRRETYISSRGIQKTSYSKDSKTTKMYFFHSGENILENLINRHNRPYKVYKTLLPKIREALGFTVDFKASWSQYCGCTSCPCSPGFNINNFHEMTGNPGSVDIYVTLKKV